jgi:hypothetical protein
MEEHEDLQQGAQFALALDCECCFWLAIYLIVLAISILHLDWASNIPCVIQIAAPDTGIFRVACTT